jgi:excinuclease UvrABC helicase subunit UvrB
VRKIFPFIDKQSSKKDNYEFYRQLGLTPDISPSLSFPRRRESMDPRIRKDDIQTNTKAKLEYAKTIRHIKLFFEGRKKELVKTLKKEMHLYAKKQEFEKANKTKREKRKKTQSKKFAHI